VCPVTDYDLIFNSDRNESLPFTYKGYGANLNVSINTTLDEGVYEYNIEDLNVTA